MVEAAHIHAFAESKDNSIGNGLALTRDAHWMFDEGLWTLSETNRVCVAKEVFTEWGPGGRRANQGSGGVRFASHPKIYAKGRASCQNKKASGRIFFTSSLWSPRFVAVTVVKKGRKKGRFWVKIRPNLCLSVRICADDKIAALMSNSLSSRWLEEKQRSFSLNANLEKSGPTRIRT